MLGGRFFLQHTVSLRAADISGQVGNAGLEVRPGSAPAQTLAAGRLAVAAGHQQRRGLIAFVLTFGPLNLRILSSQSK